MTEWNHPTGVWTWGSTALVTAVLAAPLAAALVLMPRPRSPGLLATASGLLVFTVVVVCASLLYLHWRLTSLTSVGWLTAGTALVGVHGLAMSGLQLAPVHREHTSGYAVGCEVLVGAAVLALVRLSDHRDLGVDPAALGLLTGLALAGLHILVGRSLQAPELDPDGGPAWVATAALVVVAALIAARLGRLGDLPPWARPRLALAVLALFASRTLASPGPPAGDATRLLEALFGFTGAAVLCVTCLALLRSAINEDRASIATLQAELNDLAAAARDDRERLHEVRGTIAGIATASELIGSAFLDGQQRPGLEQMVARETARLNRLLRDDVAPYPQIIDLDDLIAPLVLAHRARGRDVRWTPTGQRVVAIADDLTEVINILLDNSAHHATPGTTWVDVTQRDDQVVVQVSDDGPGVPEEVIDTMFDWGSRGPHSTGTGIGLHVAHRLLSQGGHQLRLDRTYARGAAFQLDLGQPQLDRSP